MSLADQQAALMAALSGQGAMPEGFRHDRLEAARSALALKRMRAAGRSWPAVERLLGDSFSTAFTQYAKDTPLPQEGGPMADGRTFVGWLSESHSLTDEIRLLALQFDVCNKRHPKGWRPRRWGHAAWVWLPDGQHWLVGVRIPGWMPWRAWTTSLAWPRPWRWLRGVTQRIRKPALSSTQQHGPADQRDNSSEPSRPRRRG